MPCRVNTGRIRRACIPKMRTRLVPRKPGAGAGRVMFDPTTVPVVKSSIVGSGQPDGILVQWDRAMMMTCDAKDQINIIIDGAAAVHPVSIDFHPTDKSIMGLILAVPITDGQSVTWAYDDTGACDLQGIMPPNTEADNQTYATINQVGLSIQGAFADGFSGGFL